MLHLPADYAAGLLCLSQYGSVYSIEDDPNPNHVAQAAVLDKISSLGGAYEEKVKACFQARQDQEDADQDIIRSRIEVIQPARIFQSIASADITEQQRVPKDSTVPTRPMSINGVDKSKYGTPSQGLRLHVPQSVISSGTEPNDRSSRTHCMGNII
jgi:hypothetical protein